MNLAGLGQLSIIFIYTAKKISKDIVFICNKKNIKILKNRFKDCKFAIQKKQKGTAGAVLSAKKFIKKNANILILFGDVPLISLSSLRKLINNYNQNNNNLGVMLAFNTIQPFAYGRVITVKVT